MATGKIEPNIFLKILFQVYKYQVAWFQSLTLNCYFPTL